MRAVHVLEELEIFGSSQWGLVTTAQARALGIDRLWLSRMNARGTLHRIRHGVYALPSARYGPWQDLQAAWLTTEPALAAEARFKVDDPVVVSHASAAAIHGLGNLIPSRHQFSSPARRQTIQKDMRFHCRQIPHHDQVWITGLPVTSVLRTVADLAEAAVDFDHLAHVVRDAVTEHRVQIQDLAERLFPHANNYGVETGGKLVAKLLDRFGYAPPASPTRTADAAVWMEQITQMIPELVIPEMREIFQEEISASLAKYLDDALLAHIQAQAINEFSEMFQKVLKQSPTLSKALTGMAPLATHPRHPTPPVEEANPGVT